MDRVSISFHKNLLLLTKLVAPHGDFKKHFKEGMFDKPNTTGFVHVSYYLSSIYYKENLKNKVPWPVICKQSENQFRNDMRKCITVIANEHLDVNFPPILASHLFLAGGTKFILIMWKLSLVVLRSHLIQEYHCIISNSPKSGPCQELTLKFFQNVIKKNISSMSSVRYNRLKVEKEAKKFLNKKSEEQCFIKEKILLLIENLKDLVNTVPANNIARMKFNNIEDKEIVNLCRSSMNETLQIVEKNCHNFKEMTELFIYISKIVSNFTGHSQILNNTVFNQIIIDTFYEFKQSETQVTLCNLYQDNALNLKNYFSIFTLILKNYKGNLQENRNIELLKVNQQIKNNNKQLTLVLNDFQKLHKHIETCKINLNQNGFSDSIPNVKHFLANAPEYTKVLFMPSPCIQIMNNSDRGATSVFQNDLKLTPAESPHKNLFLRHGESNIKKNIFPVKKNSLCIKIDFDDESLSENNTCKSSKSNLQRYKLSSKASNFKNSEKYSRLFSTIKPNRNKGINYRMMTMMSLNSILPQESCLSMIDSHNLREESNQEPFLADSNLNSTVDSMNQEKILPQNQKRRSISDLVERYKNLVQNRDNII